MPGAPRCLPERSLPERPDLRYLKLEAKRRLAAGQFPSLHDAQAAIAREHVESFISDVLERHAADDGAHLLRLALGVLPLAD